MRHTNESKEMYLEVMYELSLKDKNIRLVDIARKLNYSKPSVTRAMSALKKDGCILQEPYGPITLTEKGIEAAKFIKNRHVYLTKYLMLSLGIDEKLAEKDACRMEHIVSHEIMVAVREYVHNNANKRPIRLKKDYNLLINQ